MRFRRVERIGTAVAVLVVALVLLLPSSWLHSVALFVLAPTVILVGLAAHINMYRGEREKAGPIGAVTVASVTTLAIAIVVLVEQRPDVTAYFPVVAQVIPTLLIVVAIDAHNKHLNWDGRFARGNALGLSVVGEAAALVGTMLHHGTTVVAEVCAGVSASATMTLLIYVLVLPRLQDQGGEVASEAQEPRGGSCRPRQ